MISMFSLPHCSPVSSNVYVPLELEIPSAMRGSRGFLGQRRSSGSQPATGTVAPKMVRAVARAGAAWSGASALVRRFSPGQSRGGVRGEGGYGDASGGGGPRE